MYKPELSLRAKYGKEGLEPCISIAFIYQNKKHQNESPIKAL
jgi:hypothetical protein